MCLKIEKKFKERMSSTEKTLRLSGVGFETQPEEKRTSIYERLYRKDF